ncbi:RNA-binding region RNP-1 domain-containing protein [Aphelenchoides avenae]|nr:RNA-binding region RNP-1 domain-containing protein [Aphelenchus avenae]
MKGIKQGTQVLRSAATAAQLQPTHTPLTPQSLAIVCPQIGTARAQPVPPVESIMTMRRTVIDHLLPHVAKVFSPDGGIPYNENRRHVPTIGLTRRTVPVVQKTGFMDMYRCSRQGLRVGMIMEEMDGMTTVVGHMHNQDPNYPIPSENSHMGQHKVGVVSAGYRRIDLPTEAVFQPDRDIVLSGFVSWTGKSSMEITIDALQKDDHSGGMK